MTAGAQDYVSEVLYPDDLIPVEDLEGKIDYFFLFCNFLFRSKGPHTTSNTTSNNSNYNNNNF